MYEKHNFSTFLLAFGKVTVYVTVQIGVVVARVVFICIFLMANDAKHLFVCLFAICISFLVKCLFMSIFYFESCVLVWWMVAREAWYCLVLFGSECIRMEASDLRTVRHG